MADDYLPRRELLLKAWAINFRNTISQSYVSLGLTTDDATQLRERVDAFVAALLVSGQPSTRTTVTVADKRDASAAMRDLIRRLVRRIQSLPHLTNVEREKLGITLPHKPKRVASHSSKPPLEVPFVHLAAIRDRQLQVQLVGDNGTGRKPDGVIGAVLYWKLDGQINAPWHMSELTSQRTVVMEVPQSVPGGSGVWISACWLNRRLERGPAARPELAFVSDPHYASPASTMPQLAA